MFVDCLDVTHMDPLHTLVISVEVLVLYIASDLDLLCLHKDIG